MVSPHNIYLHVATDFGILGVLAALAAGIAALRLAVQVLRAPHLALYYGLACGLVAGVVGFAVYGFFESAVGGGPKVAGTWHYWVSPIPSVLAGLLVATARRLWVLDQ